MNTFMFLFIFFLASTCKADVVAFNQPATAQTPPSLQNQNVQTIQNLPNAIELQKITINHIQKRRILLSMDSIAEAAEHKATPLNALSADNRHSYRSSAGLISAISPDYTVKRGFLSLSKVSYTRHKEAIMFVFLMNKDKADITTAKDNPRARMHILGSKKIFPEQRLIENEYPVDVSIARYDDGYAPEEWNLILPSKKPREVKVALLWSF